MRSRKHLQAILVHSYALDGQRTKTGDDLEFIKGQKTFIRIVDAYHGGIRMQIGRINSVCRQCGGYPVDGAGPWMRTMPKPALLERDRNRCVERVQRNEMRRQAV